jgi:hypothetical protein
MRRAGGKSPAKPLGCCLCAHPYVKIYANAGFLFVKWIWALANLARASRALLTSNLSDTHGSSIYPVIFSANCSDTRGLRT